MFPSHNIMTGMSCNFFHYIWRHIHFKTPDEDSNNIVWFSKVSQFVNHTRNVSSSILIKPGLCVAINEMMVRCKGRCSDTHRMKNKPIDTGYKLFALADSQSGFACFFTPDGRVSGEQGLNEYSRANTEGRKNTSYVDAFVPVSSTQ